MAQSLTVLRRLFLKPAAARLLFTWGDSSTPGGAPGLPRLSADADEASPGSHITLTSDSSPRVSGLSSLLGQSHACMPLSHAEVILATEFELHSTVRGTKQHPLPCARQRAFRLDAWHTA